MAEPMTSAGPGDAAVRVREATATDGDELARMRWDFTFEDHDEKPIETAGLFRDRFLKRWIAFCTSGRWTVWVAELAHSPRRLVGCVWVETIDKISRPIPHADEMGYVTNVYVEPGWRDQGIGSRLLQAAIDRARERGFHSLVLWPSERSIEFYRRAGFEQPPDILELHFES